MRHTQRMQPCGKYWLVKTLFHLQHREIEDQIKTVQARVLVLVGDGDWLIPSREEGPRLQKLLPRCILRVRLPHRHVAGVLPS